MLLPIPPTIAIMAGYVNGIDNADDDDDDKKGGYVNDDDDDDDDNKKEAMSTPINILQSPLGI